MPRLTRDTILDAALALVQRDGLQALTMRALAEELDVTATALYYHFDGREDLLRALVGRATARLVTSTDQGHPWQDQIVDLLLATAAELGRAPDLAVWILTTQARQPPVLALHEMLLSILTSAGISVEKAVEIKGAVLRLLIGHVVLAAADDGPAWSRVPKRYPHLRAAAEEHRTTDRTATLERAIRAVLDAASLVPSEPVGSAHSQDHHGR